MEHDPESVRAREDGERIANWKRWGPYLSERQWGTVREDYSPDGEAWKYFPFEHSHLRTYRWGEDGLLGWSDRQCRLCFAVTLWNGRDPILKERLYGLDGHQGNHGEDCKELYFYLDSTPTHSYAKAAYCYPQAEFPYAALRERNAARTRMDPELELEDLGVFDEGRYFDVVAEFAKRSPEDLLIRITVTNCGPDPAEIHVLPTLWFRNVWSWGRTGEAYRDNPRIFASPRPTEAYPGGARAESSSLGNYHFDAETPGDWLYTDNVSNAEVLWESQSESPYTKDAFGAVVIDGQRDRVNPEHTGTKVAVWTRHTLPPGGKVVLRLRLHALSEGAKADFGPAFDAVFAERIAEADRF